MDNIQLSFFDDIPESNKNSKSPEYQAYCSLLPTITSALYENHANSKFLKYKGNISYSSILFGPYLAFRIKLTGKKRYISIPDECAHLVSSELEPYSIKSEIGEFIRIPVKEDDVMPFAQLVYDVVSEVIDKIPKEFDCCHLYEACSNARACVHDDSNSTDDMFSLKCGYRKILKSGRIFYGKNKNV